MHPGRRRVGQDPGAHPPHRPPDRHRRGRRPATSSPSPSPARRPASCARRLGALGVRDGVAAGTFHASPTASSAGAGPTGASARPRCSTARCASSCRLLGRRSQRTPRSSRPTSPARSSGPRPGIVDPSDYAAEADGRPVARRRCRSPRWPRSTARYEDEKHGARAASTSTTCCWLCGTAIERRHRVRRRPALAVPPPVRRRVPGREPGAVPPAARLAGRSHADLCVVGDPNQAIYAWNGADAATSSTSPAASPAPRSCELADNYRSTPQILAVANAVLGGGRPRATRHRRRRPVPLVRAFDTDDATKRRGIARARPPGARHRRAVVRHRGARAHQRPGRAVRGGASATPASRSGCAAAEPSSSSPRCSDALTEPASGRRAASPPGPPTSRPRSPHVDESDERRCTSSELVRLAADFAALDATPGAAGFIAWLAATVARRGGRRPPATRVDIVTFHRAKGLEWPVVFVAGLERGLVPIGHADTPEAEAEERRLLYVAVTRAEHELHCTWAERRTFGTKAGAAPAVAVARPIEDVRARLEGRAPAIIEPRAARPGSPSARAKLPKGKSRRARPAGARRPQGVAHHRRAGRRRAGLRDLPRHDARRGGRGPAQQRAASCSRCPASGR